MDCLHVQMGNAPQPSLNKVVGLPDIYTWSYMYVCAMENISVYVYCTYIYTFIQLLCIAIQICVYYSWLQLHVYVYRYVYIKAVHICLQIPVPHIGKVADISPKNIEHEVCVFMSDACLWLFWVICNWYLGLVEIIYCMLYYIYTRH